MSLSILANNLVPLIQTEISAALNRSEAKFAQQLQALNAAPASLDDQTTGAVTSAFATDLATQIQNLIADALARYRTETATASTADASEDTVEVQGTPTASAAVMSAVTPTADDTGSGATRSALLQSIGERGRGLLAQMPASAFYREEAPQLLAEAVSAGEITRGQAHAARILYGLQTDLTNAENAVGLGQRGLDQAIALRNANWYGDPAKAARLESRIEALTRSLAQSQAQVARLTPLVTDFSLQAGAAAELFSTPTA